MRIYKIADSRKEDFDLEVYKHTQDFLNRRDEEYQNILAEYYRNKERKAKDKAERVQQMSWEVIPFARLKRIWEDYARWGVVRDERGMRDIVDRMLKILARLNAANDLAGHGIYDEKEMEQLTGYKMPDGKDFEFYFDFLSTEYGEPVSDFGLPKLNDLAFKLMGGRSPTNQLLLVDQMLNVVHQRGDLSALFIEGGEESLGKLFDSRG